MMTESQRRAMIIFHRKMEGAFRAVGKIEDAEAARKRAEDLEREEGRGR